MVKGRRMPGRTDLYLFLQARMNRYLRWGASGKAGKEVSFRTLGTPQHHYPGISVTPDALEINPIFTGIYRALMTLFLGSNG